MSPACQLGFLSQTPTPRGGMSTTSQPSKTQSEISRSAQTIRDVEVMDVTKGALSF